MIAVLSNINCDPIIRKIRKITPCVENIGYGNVVEALLNPQRMGEDKNIEAVFCIIDLKEYIQLSNEYKQRIDEFFIYFERGMNERCKYFISDAYYYIQHEVDFRGNSVSRRGEHYWNEKLYSFCDTHNNCYVFPLKKFVCNLGEKEFFSNLLWYHGSARYSLDAVKSISSEIIKIIDVVHGKYKKAILLDLDNTLWGGIAGEDGFERIALSDSGIGKAYKEFQGVIRLLKESGTVLAIVSKNNESDVWPIFEKHPHMILKKDDFVSHRINWDNKSDNIKAIAAELNIGLDSMVFVDDNPLERAEVKSFLPQVEVPDFPDNPEKLTVFAEELIHRYFLRLTTTQEDMEKTKMYHAMHQIEKARSSATNFSDFLKSLNIVITRCNPSKHFERIVQLNEKTNQFNTTVKRYSASEIKEMLNSSDWCIYLYEVSDRFANHGLCAVAFVNLQDSAIIDNFIMSCRVMGRNIEYGIIKDIENNLYKEGFSNLIGIYKKGPKNAPVETLFDNAGYILSSENKEQGLKEYNKIFSESEDSECFYGKIVYEI